MDVSVIIPTHNRRAQLETGLARLATQDFGGEWEVIVVANRCDDDTVDVIGSTQFPVPLRVLDHQVPGPAAARNAGLAMANGDYTILMDDDIVPGPTYVSDHYASVSQRERTIVLGILRDPPQVANTPFGRFRAHYIATEIPDEPTEVDGFSSGSTSFRTKEFLALGGFDETFTTASLEDDDIAIKAIDAGITLLHDPSIEALHDDWAARSIEAYCRRQFAYAYDAPLIAEKFGDRRARTRWVEEATSPVLNRSVGLTIRRVARRLASVRLGRRAILATCAGLERAPQWTSGPWLFAAYKAAIASSVTAGVRRGVAGRRGTSASLRRTATPQTPP